jgi:hypothetical protein
MTGDDVDDVGVDEPADGPVIVDADRDEFENDNGEVEARLILKELLVGANPDELTPEGVDPVLEKVMDELLSGTEDAANEVTEDDGGGTRELALGLTSLAPEAEASNVEDGGIEEDSG